MEQMDFLGRDTLKEAVAWLQSRIDKGAECPCCGRFAKVYIRGLYDTMARGLIHLVRRAEAGNEWIHSFEIGLVTRVGSSDFPKLRFWDFITNQPKDPDDTVRKESGMWRPTQKGIDFVYNRISVPARIRTWNDTLLGYVDESETINIVEALGEQFNYRRLMDGEIPDYGQADSDD